MQMQASCITNQGQSRGESQSTFFYFYLYVERFFMPLLNAWLQGFDPKEDYNDWEGILERPFEGMYCPRAQSMERDN